MKRRAVYFLFCVYFCFSSLLLSFSAVDDGYIYNPGSGSYYLPEEFTDPEVSDPEEVEEEFAGDPDMLEEGWIYDNGDYYIPSDFQLPSVFLRTKANYPDFDPNDIPWDSAPEAVKNVLFNTPFISTNTLDYVNPWKIPFVLVITNGDVVRVFAGINLVFLTYFATSDDRDNFTPTGSYVGIQVLNSNGSVVTGVEYAFCYEAVFDFDTMKITTPWRTAEKASIGNRFTRFSGNILSLDSKYDFYGYGGNNVGPGKIQFSYHTSSNGTGYPAVYAVTDSSIGFAAGASAFVFGNAQYSNAYFAPFTPQTFEQKEHETNKGILDNVKGVLSSVKDLPNTIGEKIKSLFIPKDGFFNSYTTSFQDYFEDRFGLLYEVPDSIINILQQFINFSPSESDYKITFPEVVLPVYENGEFYDKVIISETDIQFGFLEQGAFKTMYSLYRSVIWMIFIFALINLIIRKSKSIFGG